MTRETIRSVRNDPCGVSIQLTETLGSSENLLRQRHAPATEADGPDVAAEVPAGAHREGPVESMLGPERIRRLDVAKTIAADGQGSPRGQV